MNAMHQFALLIAVAAPCATLVGINIYLMLIGERDTLLLPGVRGWPGIALEARAEALPQPLNPAPVRPANDEAMKLAA